MSNVTRPLISMQLVVAVVQVSSSIQGIGQVPNSSLFLTEMATFAMTDVENQKDTASGTNIWLYTGDNAWDMKWNIVYV
jgi:hypothetical protein